MNLQLSQLSTQCELSEIYKVAKEDKIRKSISGKKALKKSGSEKKLVDLTDAIDKLILDDESKKA